MVFHFSSPKGRRQCSWLHQFTFQTTKLPFACHVLELLVLQELSSLHRQRLRLYIPALFRVSSHSEISASMAPEPVLSLSSAKQLSLTEMEKAQREI